MLKQKQLIIGVIVTIVLMVGSFYAGRISVSTTNSAAPFDGPLGMNGQGRGAMGAGGRTQNNPGLRGNLTSGEIISKDDKSLTIKLNDGGSKIVYFSASTTISQMSTTSPADLSVGQSVSATGSTNSDGSVSAQMIQVRPFGETFGEAPMGVVPAENRQ